MSRPARPEDLYDLRIATDPRALAGRTLGGVHRPGRGRRGATATAIRSGSSRPTARRRPGRSRSAPSTTGTPGSRPDGRSLAFISDRRLATEEMPGAPDDREDGDQIHVLPLDGGEARRRHGPAPRRRGLRLVAGRHAARRPVLVARRHPRGGRPQAGQGDEARSEGPAAVRLPLRRPPRLPVQRRRLHRRQGAELWVVDAADGGGADA